MTDKPQITEELKKVRETKQQEIANLKRDYGITPEQATIKWQELDSQSVAKQKERLNLPGVTELKRKQEAVKQEYIQMHQANSVQTSRPDNEPQKKPNHDHDKTFAERMALVKAERELQKRPTRNYIQVKLRKRAGERRKR
ncbi:MAG: hypothetical protein LBU32_14670 [Clostridiales bacterium]|nr:hypothetical protein [Clostridiales bacterium]